MRQAQERNGVLHREARCIRDCLGRHEVRRNRKGAQRKTNVTEPDPDSATTRRRGGRRHSRRMATVEPVFANLRPDKGLSRLNCAGVRKRARSGGCIARCTTSRSWRAVGEAGVIPQRGG